MSWRQCSWRGQQVYTSHYHILFSNSRLIYSWLNMYLNTRAEQLFNIKRSFKSPFFFLLHNYAHTKDRGNFYIFACFGAFFLRNGYSFIFCLVPLSILLFITKGVTFHHPNLQPLLCPCSRLENRETFFQQNKLGKYLLTFALYIHAVGFIMGRE